VFFNPFSKVIYFILFISNLVLFFTKPNLMPHYKDIFISNLMILNIPAWMLLTFVLVLIHEFGHVLAIRAYNLPTKLGIGHRLFLVVLETDMSSVWKLPSKDRNVLYLAGLCFDSVILFLALMGQTAFPAGPVLLHGVLRIIVLDTVIRMLYQGCIYMKTDLYYLFENSTGCYNVMENAQQAIKNRFSRKSSVSGEVVFDAERKTVYWYSVFYFAGIAISIALYLFFYIPQLFFAIKKILPGFEKSFTSLPFWDSSVFALQLVTGFLLLFYSWAKKYRRKVQL
jgi:putative peptide zinc metalloprotease protein